MARALSSLPGVANVDIDFPNRTATCEVQSGQNLDTQAALKALADADSRFKNSQVVEPSADSDKTG